MVAVSLAVFIFDKIMQPSVTTYISEKPRITLRYLLHKKRIFTAQRSCVSTALGVVISVHLSVCLAHACFVTNPKNLPVIFLHHMKGQSL